MLVNRSINASETLNEMPKAVSKTLNSMVALKLHFASITLYSLYYILYVSLWGHCSLGG